MRFVTSGKSAATTALAPLTMAIHLALGGIIASASLPLLAAQQNQTYNIPAGPLGEALNLFARQAGVAISFDAAQVRGLNSPGLQGSHEVPAGFARLLQSSPLQAMAGADGYVLVARSEQQGALELGATSITGTEAEGQVTTEGTGSYATTGASILKGAQSLKEIPQSVSVVTNQRIEDQNLTSLQSVMEQAPGIYTNKMRAGEGASSNSLYYSRGFKINSYMVDGVASNAASPFAGGGAQTGVDGSSAIYDRVEILRGAAGLLLGNGSPGGTINLVRKRPTFELQQRYTLSAGSWNSYRSEADISGPLMESAVLRGRMLVAYEDKERFWKNTNSETPLFYGIIESDITPTTRVSLGARYENDQEDSPNALNMYGDSKFTPSRSSNYSPKWGYNDTKNKQIFFDLKHDLNDQWNVSFALQHWEYDYEGVIPLVLPTRGQLLTRKENQKTDSIDTNVVGSFSMLGHDHQLTIGINASEQDQNFLAKYNAAWNTSNWPIIYNDLNDFNAKTDWTYNTYMRNLVKTALSAPMNEMQAKSHGLYAKLNFKLTEDLTAIIGGRTSWYDYEYYTEGKDYDPSSSGHISNEFTPYAGLIYSITPQWSAYASYADIFNPQWGYYTRAGSLIDHEIGSNYEIGLKGELLNRQLNTALAIYQVDLENTAQLEAAPYNTDCPGSPVSGGCYISTGKTRTRGFDAELNGEIASGLQLGASYTYTHSEVLKRDYAEGYASSATPRHMFKLFSAYQINDKITIGGGTQIQSKESPEQRDWPVQSGYALWHTFTRYEINKNINASLNINNIFDKKYWANGVKGYKTTYGDPRNYMLTLRIKL